MQPSFDPYHVWLGIPPAEQPPTAYRLLGLRHLEAEGEVIEHAVERVRRHLRELHAGPNAADAGRVLRDVEWAAGLLLDPQKKAAYDRQLEHPQADLWPPRDHATPAESPSALAPAAQTPAASDPAPLPEFPATELAAREAPGRTKKPPKFGANRAARRSAAECQPPSDSAALQLLKIVAGGLLGLALGYAVVYFGFGRDPLELFRRSSPQPAPTAVQE